MWGGTSGSLWFAFLSDWEMEIIFFQCLLPLVSGLGKCLVRSVALFSIKCLGLFIDALIFFFRCSFVSVVELVIMKPHPYLGFGNRIKCLHVVPGRWYRGDILVSSRNIPCASSLLRSRNSFSFHVSCFCSHDAPGMKTWSKARWYELRLVERWKESSHGDPSWFPG